jgi:hypothetical protein
MTLLTATIMKMLESTALSLCNVKRVIFVWQGAQPIVDELKYVYMRSGIPCVH